MYSCNVISCSRRYIITQYLELCVLFCSVVFCCMMTFLGGRWPNVGWSWNAQRTNGHQTVIVSWRYYNYYYSYSLSDQHHTTSSTAQYIKTKPLKACRLIDNCPSGFNVLQSVYDRNRNRNYDSNFLWDALRLLPGN